MARPTSRPGAGQSRGLTPAELPTGKESREPAHLPLHRRLLFPTWPLDRPLPCIVEGEGQELALLNERLYHLIALVFRAYILSWLPRLTKDRSVLPHINHDLILPILRPILGRIARDPEILIPLILLDLPAILTIHIETYWKARQGVRLSQQGGFEHVGERGGIDLDDWYHRHLPLISVHRSTGSGEDEAEPKKSSRDEVIERDLNEAIEGGDGPVRPIKAQPGKHAPDHESDPNYDDDSEYAVSEIWLTALVDPLLRLYLPPEEYSVVVERIMVREILARSVLGGIAKRLCASWFWYSLLLKFIPLRTTRSGSVHTAPTSKGASGGLEGGVKHGPLGQVVEAIWRTYLSILSLSIMIWMILLKLWSTAAWTMATLSSAPKHVRNRYTSQWISLGRAVLGIDGNVALERKWLTRITWGVLEVVLDLFSPMLDRLLPHLLTQHLTASTALRLVDLLERLLFPLDGYPAPTPPDPTLLEQQVMRRELEERLSMAIPNAIRSTLLPSHLELKALLDPISDVGCNAHMVGMVYTACIARLVPELAVTSATPVEGDTVAE